MGVRWVDREKRPRGAEDERMGKYDRFEAKAISGEFAESKTKKTPYVSVMFEVTEGGESKGRQFEWQGYLSDATTERTVQGLRFAGCVFPGDDITNLKGLGDKIVSIQVEDTDFGKRVAWVNEPSASSVSDETRLDPAGKKALASRLKGALLSLKGGKSAPKPIPTAGVADAFAVEHGHPANDDGDEQQATGTDDNMPF
jgi:hypothetical protein